MTSNPTLFPVRSSGRVSALVRRAARISARRPKLIIGLWVLFVMACLAAGQVTGTKSLTTIQQQPGQSGQAAALAAKAGLTQPDVESVLVRSGSAAATLHTADVLQHRFGHLPAVVSVSGSTHNSSLSANNGRTVLVQATLKGNLATESITPESNRVVTVERVVKQVARAHPNATLQEAGQGSLDRAENNVINSDLRHAELISVPVTLIILILAFGAFVAALVPLVLAFSSVGAAIGAMGLLSHIAPNSSTTASCVVLIGLAVGIDCSLFYIRRERTERRAGRSPHDALDAAAATAGRAVFVSGITVMLGLAGLLIAGVSDFTSVALGTMAVVAIAVLGSLTVLPAMLALLGDRIDKGRIWRRRAHNRNRNRAARPAAAGAPAWRALANAVTSRPAASLIASACVLGALAVPALGLRTASPTDVTDLSSSVAVVHNQDVIERDFPGAPSPAELVVTGHDLGSARHRRELMALGQRARTAIHGHGVVQLDVTRDGRLAQLTVPMAAGSDSEQTAAVQALRDKVAPTATRIAPGTKALITGSAAESVDFSNQLSAATPRVLAFVLGLAFLLLLVTFGSLWLAAAVVCLNLLSVGAAYGVLAAVFQGHWAQSLLGFSSSGTVTSWLPLFLFVVLFGLSMDYTVLVLERIREAQRAGLSTRQAAAEGIAATGGTVTSAAIIMVAVFSIFVSLHVLQLKQLGFGLAVAVALDATIVRGVALPAVVALRPRTRLGRATATPRAVAR